MRFRSPGFSLLRPTGLLAGLVAVALLVGGGPADRVNALVTGSLAAPEPGPQAATSSPRRVNAPYFDRRVKFSETAIFWFGRVTPTENSVDVRVGYSDNHLWLHVAMFDRRLWYDTSPFPAELTDWDAVTLYIDSDGDTGNLPGASSYRFEGQLVWWEPRDDYQAAYQGDGTGWVLSTTPFTTTSGWRGHSPNNDVDDRGWWLRYEIPFDSLGLSGPPAQGSVWGMALAVHDRDDGAGSPIADQMWPEAMAPQQPVTWGQLAFGIPSYDPQTAMFEGAVTIRHGLDGATVVDGDVGGSSICGQPAWPEFFPTWGELNYAGKTFVNIQNQFDVADWPCFCRYYVEFPLDAVPADKVIMSATLTLHLWGGAGEGWEPPAQPSLIQVLTVDEGWDEDTLTWNNAPLAVENVSATWVDPVDEYPGILGIPHEWDVGRAVADAYARGTPVRLALYEADYAYHSGKYFRSSDYGDYGAEGRPTLDITWGRAVADPHKIAAPSQGVAGTPVDYTLRFLGSGNTLHLTDMLPAGLGTPGHFELEGTSIAPTYDSGAHRLIWSDSPGLGEKVAIRYRASIATEARESLINTAELREPDWSLRIDSATVIANPWPVYLPLISKRWSSDGWKPVVGSQCPFGGAGGVRHERSCCPATVLGHDDRSQDDRWADWAGTKR